MTDATTRTYVGTATSASEDGSVYVTLSQDVTLPDDDDGEHGLGVEMPTTVAVDEGDEVLVTVFGGGVMKAPVVTGNPGWGDNVQAQVDNAETLAQQAEAVATATGQYFWHDTDGVHVTEVTQEDWTDAESPDYHSGANVLLNALGQLFRDGLNNLLAILSGNNPGIAIYDGTGNTEDHILAQFASDEVRIGGAIPEDGSAVATVRFFDSDASKGAMVEGYVSNSYSPTDEDVGWGVQVQDTYTDLHTSTNDSDMEQVNGCAGTADVRLGQTTYWEDGPDGYYQAESTATLIATADGGTDPTQTAHASASLGVKAVTVNDDYERSYLTVNGNDISTWQAIAGLLQPSATYTGGSSTATASSAGWQLTYFNSMVGGTVNCSEYFTNSNGVITVLKACLLEFSGVMNWTDTIAGMRGFGLFVGSTMVSSGTEHSSFTSFPSGGSTRRCVVFPPKCIPCSAGTNIAIGRYQQQNAVYQNGTNFSWLTIKVIEDRSS